MMLPPTRAGLWMGLLVGAAWLADAAALRGETLLGETREAAAKMLAWKFHAGQRFRVETVSEMTRTTKIKANVDETKVKTTIALIWEVTEVDGEGVATIVQRPDRLAITLEHRQDPKYELDSDVLAKNPQLRGPDRDAMRLLMEGVVTIKVDPRGVVRESSMPPEWVEKLGSSPLAELRDQIAQAATPQLLPGVQLTLPEGEVEAGAEWRSASQPGESPLGASDKSGTSTAATLASGAKPIGEATFIYRGEAPLEGVPRDRIEISFTLKGFPKGVTVTSQSNQGVFWFDGQEGRALQLQLTQHWKAEKEYRDNVILLTTSGGSTTTWVLLR